MGVSLVADIGIGSTMKYVAPTAVGFRGRHVESEHAHLVPSP